MRFWLSVSSLRHRQHQLLLEGFFTESTKYWISNIMSDEVTVGLAKEATTNVTIIHNIYIPYDNTKSFLKSFSRNKANK